MSRVFNNQDHCARSEPGSDTEAPENDAQLQTASFFPGYKETLYPSIATSNNSKDDEVFEVTTQIKYTIIRSSSFEAMRVSFRASLYPEEQENMKIQQKWIELTEHTIKTTYVVANQLQVGVIIPIYLGILVVAYSIVLGNKISEILLGAQSLPPGVVYMEWKCVSTQSFQADNYLNF